MAITYPVDPNSRWALYSISQAEIIRHNSRWPRADGQELIGLDPDLVPLLEVREDQPAFDPATQKLEPAPPVVDVNANTHTHGWDVVALTQRELDERSARQQHESNATQAKSIYQDLKNGVGTSGERLQRVERVAAWLLKERFFDDLDN